MIPIRTKGGSSPRSSRQAVREAPTSKVVAKPVPEGQVQDARGYQIGQIKRRFSPKEDTSLDGTDTRLLFNLAPSDPDFPFELHHLEVELRVPAAYPSKPPRLLVRNSNIPKGFAINIEKGWDRLVGEKPGATLLALVNALDRNLESFLSEQKAETVTLMTFKDTKPPSPPPAPAPKPPPVERRPYVPRESFSRDQIAEAKARRAQEARQLEARMSRLPLYQRSSDGIVYTLPLEPKRRAQLPAGLQAVNSVQLIIPLLYPLQPLRILLNEVESEDAEGLEELFSRKAAEQKQMSLTSHINYLAQNLHLLAKEAQNSLPKSAPPPEAEPEAAAENKETEIASAPSSGKSHIHVIPRPPEWAMGGDSSESEEEEEYSSDEDDDEDGGATVGEHHAGKADLPTHTAERGTAILFPSVELHGIELLQVSLLSLVVKCDRCKTLNEATGLRDGVEKVGSCKKCATPFAITFRAELVHQNSTRAGFIDVSACTVADLLPRYAASSR